jgi:CelD/BcsL family acetyltransferase involved in cellulose biosynthesis
MKCFVIGPAELGSQERARWRELQCANPSLASPCFSWQFTLATADVRRDVRIAVLEEDGAIAGFFPHHWRLGAGEPIAGRMSDHHGVIAAPGTRWDWHELLKAARLSYWPFDHLPGAQRAPGVAGHAESPGLDLSQGFDAWLARKRAQGASVAKLPARLRRTERDLGPLRLTLHSRDRDDFETVIRLKSEQCRRTGQLDFFALGWPRALVERIRDIDDPDFGGRLSTLHAGDVLLAAHFGMRTPQVWHWWFPVYSAAHRQHSPGSLLLLQVAHAAAAEGHQLLDLGRGDEEYKRRFSDCSWPLLEGCVSRPTAVTAARRWKKQVGQWLRTSPVAAPALPLLKRLKRLAAAVVFVPMPDLMPLAPVWM